MRIIPGWVWPVGLIAAAACGGDDSNGMPPSPEPEPTATLSGDVQPIFSSNCAFSGCHAGSNPEEGMDLSLGRTFGSIVDVPSVQAPLPRVRPLLPDSSYLVHKIQGTQASVGGSGERMPLDAGALTADDIAVIRDWIEAGALDN